MYNLLFRYNTMALEKLQIYDDIKETTKPTAFVKDYDSNSYYIYRGWS